MKMSKCLGDKSFKCGVVLGISLFLLAQIASFIVYVVSIETFKNPPGMNIDKIWHYGFPFPIYFGADYYSFNANQFILGGIIVNILIALIFSFAIGLVFKLIWSKLASRRLNLK
jgi:hypothetical protein